MTRPTVQNRLLLLLCLWLLPVLPCMAKDRGPIRPVGKGTKIGAMGKDYVFLMEPCVAFVETFGVWRSTTILPAGQYQVEHEDNLGFYLPAPALIQEVQQGSTQRYINSYGGGLYIRKDRVGEMHIYRVNPSSSQIVAPNLSGIPLNQKVTRKLRQ